jgi:protein-tyrosine-phosphatase
VGEGGDLPGAVLFACAPIAVRSPMAAAMLRHLAGRRIYVESAGVRPGEPDPFALAVMEEIGIDMSIGDLHDLSFDLIVTLAPEAQHKALELAHGYAIDVEYWPTPDPTLASGSREQILDAYREVRDRLFTKIKQRFPRPAAGGVRALWSRPACELVRVVSARLPCITGGPRIPPKCLTRNCSRMSHARSAACSATTSRSSVAPAD